MRLNRIIISFGEMIRMRVKGLKIGLFGLCLLLGVNYGAGQTTERFRSRLATPDATHRSRVLVREVSDAAAAVRKVEARDSKTKTRGYRVRIFFDNSQDARRNANITKESFEAAFPDVQAQISYENPYWKVTVGSCSTNEEAIMLWGRIQSMFNLAFVVREEIPISDFSRRAE